MPNYDYLCDACGHEFEQFQSMTDSPLKNCPHCGQEQLRRLVGGGVGLIFKGSGFYHTDYKNKAHSGLNSNSASKSNSSSDKKDKSSTSDEKKSPDKAKTPSSKSSGDN